MYCEWNNIKHPKYFFTIGFSFSPCYCFTDFLLDIFFMSIEFPKKIILCYMMEYKINPFKVFFFHEW